MAWQKAGGAHSLFKAGFLTQKEILFPFIRRKKKYIYSIYIKQLFSYLYHLRFKRTPQFYVPVRHVGDAFTQSDAELHKLILTQWRQTVFHPTTYGQHSLVTFVSKHCHHTRGGSRPIQMTTPGNLTLCCIWTPWCRVIPLENHFFALWFNLPSRIFSAWISVKMCVQKRKMSARCLGIGLT